MNRIAAAARRVLPLLLAGLAPGWVGAQTASDSVALSQLLDAMTTLHASFEQRVESVDGQLLDESSGIVWLRKPAQLRWDVTAPLEQQIVVDGDTYYQYDRDIDQLLIDRLDQQLSALPQVKLIRSTASTAKPPMPHRLPKV